MGSGSLDCLGGNQSSIETSTHVHEDCVSSRVGDGEIGECKGDGRCGWGSKGDGSNNIFTLREIRYFYVYRCLPFGKLRFGGVRVRS